MNGVDGVSRNERLRMDWKRHAALVLVAGLAVATMGCSVGDLLVREPTAEPTATKTPRPTFTPTPQDLVLKQTEEQPAPAAQAEVATSAPTEPQVEPTAVPPEPTPTPEPPTPAPPTTTPEPAYVTVQEDKVNVRKGPGTAYPVVGQVVKSTRLEVVAKNQQSDWFQVCCFQGQQVWVVARLVEAHGPLQAVPVAANIPPPPPATSTPRPLPPTATPPPAATPRPVYAFDRARGPEFYSTSNLFLNIFVKVFEGVSPNEKVLEGYQLKVLRNGADVSDGNLSHGGVFDDTGPLGGNLKYNLKYELYPDAGEASWTISLADSSGQPVSPESQFTTAGSASKNRVIYVAYKRVR